MFGEQIEQVPPATIRSAEDRSPVGTRHFLRLASDEVGADRAS